MEENYHLLIESIKDYAIYMLDSKGYVSTWNAGAERMKGYREEEVLGKHFSLFFLPEDRDSGKPEQEMQTALSTGRYEEEGWRMRKNGSRFWANVILTPIFSDTKEHIGFAKVTRDLTEKKRNEELYLLLVNQVKEYALFMMDNDGNILTWNEGAQRIKGYEAPEIIGRNFSVFYSSEEVAANKPAKALQIATAEGKYEEEGWRYKKDGSRFWANIVITPIYKDERIGFAKVTRDLTRRREMEHLTRANTILEATNRELERFTYIASHDLKEPLRKTITFVDLIKSDKSHPLSEKQSLYLQKITEFGSRMTALIDDLLNFSTLSEKQHFQKCSLEKIVTGTLEVLEQTIEEKNAHIGHNLLPDVIAIPSQMQQLFQNLISNSLKFTKKGVPPRITIEHQFIKRDALSFEELWPAEEYLQLTFTDNGIGFEQEHAEKIFNLFDRLHSKAAYEGTGIGLAICKKITENHGGIIRARAEPGNGAEFTLVIHAL